VARGRHRIRHWGVTSVTLRAYNSGGQLIDTVTVGPIPQEGNGS
jgi:hypothetical protein